jgi:hypothetical protein
MIKTTNPAIQSAVTMSTPSPITTKNIVAMGPLGGEAAGAVVFTNGEEVEGGSAEGGFHGGAAGG